MYKSFWKGYGKTFLQKGFPINNKIKNLTGEVGLIMKEDRYILQAEEFLKEADEELKRGNLRQASEKYWGAASQAVKALAEKKGLKHDGHALLFQNIARFAKEYNDEEIRRFFYLAHILHVNFYEGWLSKRDIESTAISIKKFVDKIKTILKNRGDAV